MYNCELAVSLVDVPDRVVGMIEAWLCVITRFVRVRMFEDRLFRLRLDEEFFSVRSKHVSDLSSQVSVLRSERMTDAREV